MMENGELTGWLLRFLNFIPEHPNDLTKLAVENATGLL